ncbi:hypothetical protein PCL_09588 [Purpureocillium lilacinum]|uniref:Uncharacterized protein n=1 Tax=Purpureocillium lilacinum TaxID=33203 RepID=A0A2U3DQH2_PURLI|nr:hypothetical protein PCL_09588 [Purpureocillium lilacinum]
MPVLGSRDEVCLGVAVDHRILRLFKKVQRPSGTSTAGTPGTHITSLQTYGRELKRSEAEVKVTSVLACPSTMGGIVVILQQPGTTIPSTRMGPDELVRAFQASTEVVCGKKPDVVLCAGRFYNKLEQEKGQAKNFESLGVGFVYCQTIGSTGITAGIVVIDENYLEELSVNARQCAALYTQKKDSLCGAESL